MASNITSQTKAALVEAVRTIWHRINAAIGVGGFQEDADDLSSDAAVLAMNTEYRADIMDAISNHRDDLAQIKVRGRLMMDPILIQMAREASSRVIEAGFVASWPRLFRDVNADLLGGTPDYVNDRNVSFASNPSISATGIFRRLTVDSQGQTIEDGYHNQTKVIRIISKPARYQSIAQVEGQSNNFGDDFDYRGGRTDISAAMAAINDARTPGGILNPYFVPNDLTHGAVPTSFPNWTMNLTGTPTFTVDTSVLWRSRAHSIKFLGDNTEALELTQVIPASVFSDPFRPWDIGLPVRLETGWQGTIDITWGGKTQQFTHGDLTNGAFVHLFPDLDKDLYPKQFDAAGAMWKVKFTNGQNNAQAIWFTAMLPQQMTQHEGIWYSHYSDASEPVIEATVSIADTCDFVGKIQDVIAFLYQDIAPGEAHLPSTGATTIDDPEDLPVMQLLNVSTPVANGGTVALGSVASGPHTIALKIRNDGDYPLLVQVPTDDNATNATLTDPGMTEAILVAPGETADVTVEVTDGGAGAFTIDLHYETNDPDAQPYDVTISGTAT